MKTEIKKLRYSRIKPAVVLAIIQLTMLLGAMGQQVAPKIEPHEKAPKIETKQKKTEGQERLVEKKIDIDFRPNVNIRVYDTKIEIYPSRGNEIVAKVLFTAITESQEDLETLKAAMVDNLIVKNGNNISISLKFYKTMVSTITPTKWKTTIKLKNNAKIKLAEFQIKEIKIYVPADLDMAINAKYSKVNLNFSVNGDLKITGYDMVMSAKNVSNKLDVNAKYSKFEFITAGNTNLVLYESRFKAEKIKKTKIDSKYTHLHIGAINRLDYTGYEDRVRINELPVAEIVGKYCEFEIKKCKYANADMYEGSLKIGKSKKVMLSSKYLEAEFGRLNKLQLTDGYENDFVISEIDTLTSVNGKYDEFEIEKFNSILKVDGYENDVKIESVTGSFEKIWITGKYMDLSMNISNEVAYKFYGKIKYPDFKVDKSAYKIVYHNKENSNLDFEYFKNSKTVKSEIKIDGYEMNVKISHQ